jgi:hypothetical protein
MQRYRHHIIVSPPMSIINDANIKQVQGLGPLFKLKLNIKNTGVKAVLYPYYPSYHLREHDDH